MTRLRFTLAVLLLPLMCSLATAEDYRVEKIDGGPEEGEISDELAALMDDSGYRVIRGTSRTAAEIWFAKDWKLDPDFEPSATRLYPFTEGQLIGVLHFSRRGSDFRDQSVSSGWYTLRFALQPVDGNHVGTSPTRDFLVIISADQDEPDKEWDTDSLNEASSEVAGSTHPAMLCLQLASEGEETKMVHQESVDWWMLHAVGNGTANGKAQKVPIDIVVAGHAAE